MCLLRQLRVQRGGGGISVGELTLPRKMCSEENPSSVSMNCRRARHRHRWQRHVLRLLHPFLSPQTFGTWSTAVSPEPAKLLPSVLPKQVVTVACPSVTDLLGVIFQLWCHGQLEPTAASAGAGLTCSPKLGFIPLALS